MGMDIYGRKPKTATGTGVYFRFSVWAWRPMLAIMTLAGCDIPKSWNYNDGEGPNDQASCTILAEKIESFMAQCDDSDLTLPAHPHLMINKSGMFQEGQFSPYKITREHVADFCAFLRNCEGFQIF